VANVNYLFEGKNYIQLGYQQVDDLNYRGASTSHGAKESDRGSFKRFNLLNSSARMLTPGFVFNTTKQQMLAYLFVQYYQTMVADQETDGNEPWVLTAFSARQEPYTEFVDYIKMSFSQNDIYTW